jgi:hypothetical protein
LENSAVKKLGLGHRPPQIFRWSLVGLSLTGVVLGPLSPLGAQPGLVAANDPSPAAVDPANPTDPAAPLPPEDATAPLALERYVYADLFSIGFPEGWQVTEQESSPQLTALAFSSPETGPETDPESALLRTEITWHTAPPQEIVPQALQTIQTNGYTVARYDAIKVDGTTALRLWLTDLPEEGKSQAFMSYVGYPNATAVIVSYYRDRTPDLDNLLSGIHQSFQRVIAVE